MARSLFCAPGSKSSAPAPCWRSTPGGVGQLAIAQALKEAHVVMPVEFVKLAWVSIIG